MLQPLKKKRLYEEIVDQILQLIHSGELKPGDRLPPERELAEQLNVSRTAIREAMRALESMGYTESKIGGGTFVRALTLDSLINPVSIVLSQDDRMLEDVLEFRLVLETKCAALAAQRGTDEQFEALEKITADMRREVEGGRLGSEYDERFHQKLVEASGNEALCTIFQMCAGLLEKTIVSIASIPEQPRIACDMHENIVRAVRARDCRRAEALMEEHLRQIYRRLNIDAPVLP